MSWARSIAIGLGVGAIVSVTPFELALLAPLAIVIALRSPVQLARTGPTLAPLKFAALRLALIIVVVAAAMAAPFKHVDAQTKLESPCVTLAAAAKAARWRSDQLPQGALERQICVTSTTPTLKELQSAFEQSGVTARFGYCGNGATLLLGAHPIGGPRLMAMW